MDVGDNQSAAASASTSTASNDQRNSSESISDLRLSEITLEPADSSGGVNANSADSTDAQSDAAAELKLSRLSREPDVSTSADVQHRKVDSVRTETPSAVAEAVTATEGEAGAKNSQPQSVISEIRSSLPKQSSSVDSREDIVSWFRCLLFMSVVVPCNRLVFACVKLALLVGVLRKAFLWSVSCRSVSVFVTACVLCLCVCICLVTKTLNNDNQFSPKVHLRNECCIFG